MTKYDAEFNSEVVTEEYTHNGFNCKVAFVVSGRFGNMYYAVADTGEPFVDSPDFYQTPEDAKAALNEMLNNW